MKKYIIGLLLVVLSACNNEAKQKTGADAYSKNETDKKKSSMGVSGCGRLVLFQKGAVIEGKTFDATGKENGSQVTTITEVKSENGEMVAVANMDMHSTYSGKDYAADMNVTYKCNGQVLYLDLKSFLAGLTAMKDAKVEGTALEFPLNLSVGQTLPDASVNIQMNMGGKKMKTSSTYANRKVEASESVTTEAGTWKCFRISSEIKTRIDMGDGEVERKMADAINAKNPMQKTIMWFSPDAGVIKTEMYKEGQLYNRSEITAIKQ